MPLPRKLRVLLADDESHIRLLIKTLTLSLNCEIVAEAGNGVEAVELFKKTKPDIVFLDIKMPVKTGDEALAEIMAIRSNALVIMLTSLADMETVQRCISLGATNYIRKDTPIQEIKRKIMETFNAYLRKTGTADA